MYKLADLLHTRCRIESPRLRCICLPWPHVRILFFLLRLNVHSIAGTYLLDKVYKAQLPNHWSAQQHTENMWMNLWPLQRRRTALQNHLALRKSVLHNKQ